MKAEALLELYERVAEAPDAIVRLRRFVLDLAVRGRLVEQRSEDEPAASSFRKHFAAQQAKKYGKQLPLSGEGLVAASAATSSMPRGWMLATLGEVGEWGSGSTPPRSQLEYYGGGITWLKSGELGDSTSLYGSEETVTEKALEECSFRKNKAGDVLIAMYGATIGRLAILGAPAVTNQAVCGCTPHPFLLNRYLFLFLLSKRSSFHAASEGGAQPNISKVKIVNKPILLPPLAEQHRIVAKVDELMELLDRLEAARSKREATRDRLTTATLARLTEADVDPESRRTHARFALDALPALTNRADQVKQLRQTILSLAVRGKLVRNRLIGEGGSQLVQEIKKRKSQEGAHRSTKRNPVSHKAEVSSPDWLPHGWAFVRLGEIVRIRTGKLDANAAVTDGAFPFFTCSQTPSRIDSFSFETDAVLLAGNGDFNLKKYSGKFDAYQRTYVIEPIGWNLDYCYLTIQANLKAITSNNRGTAVPYLKLADITDVPVALPPLSEQHDIVAKVDELMGLCDRLEDALQTTDTKRALLLEALLHDALSSDSTERKVA